jgi:hypothetical protein
MVQHYHDRWARQIDCLPLSPHWTVWSDQSNPSKRNQKGALRLEQYLLKSIQSRKDYYNKWSWPIWTTKEVWYQELQARHRLTTVGCVKYIMNTKYAICKGRVLLDRLGLNQCVLIGNPLPRSQIGCPMCFQGGFGDFLLSMN